MKGVWLPSAGPVPPQVPMGTLRRPGSPKVQAQCKCVPEPARIKTSISDRILSNFLHQGTELGFGHQKPTHLDLDSSQFSWITKVERERMSA